jgi:hypothetical protein
VRRTRDAGTSSDHRIGHNLYVPAAINPVLAERLARHGFIHRPARTVAEAARLTTAIQAQDPGASRLGLWARARGVTEQDVLVAINDDRTVVRTWLMRATVHLVAADDVRWLTSVIGPSFAGKFRKRWLDIGLTPEVLDRTAAALPLLLADGPKSRRALMAGLAAQGIGLDLTDPQARSHILLHATGIGMVCRGPDLGRDPTFALLDQWLPNAPSASNGPTGDEALAELARRYFAAFSPATPADFATWSGLPSSKAIALIRDELTPIEVDGRAGFTLGPVEARRGLRLLSGFDNYLVGYRDRDLFMDPAYRDRVYVGGVIRPTVLLDGRIVGTWRLARTKTAASVTVAMFDTPARKVQLAIEAEVADIGAFIGLRTELAFATSPDQGRLSL